MARGTSEAPPWGGGTGGSRCSLSGVWTLLPPVLVSPALRLQPHGLLCLLSPFKKIHELFERDRRHGEPSICCSIYSCTHWLILVCAPTGMEHASLAYQDDVLTNWATWLGLLSSSLPSPPLTSFPTDFYLPRSSLPSSPPPPTLSLFLLLPAPPLFLYPSGSTHSGMCSVGDSTGH